MTQTPRKWLTAIGVYDTDKKKSWGLYMAENMILWNKFMADTDALVSQLSTLKGAARKTALKALAALCFNYEQASHKPHDEFVQRATALYVANSVKTHEMDVATFAAEIGALSTKPKPKTKTKKRRK